MTATNSNRVKMTTTDKTRLDFHSAAARVKRDKSNKQQRQSKRFQWEEVE